MPHASIEWVLGQNCHRLICVIQSDGADHTLTVFFDAVPVASYRCESADDLQAAVAREKDDWGVRGWRPVEVPPSLLRMVPVPTVV
jgi:hypothetical protein